MVHLTCTVLITYCSIINLEHVAEKKKQMKNYSKGFMHSVTIYGSEHSEIQHYDHI